jgi:hypothetical protein
MGMTDLRNPNLSIIKFSEKKNPKKSFYHPTGAHFLCIANENSVLASLAVDVNSEARTTRGS